MKILAVIISILMTNSCSPVKNKLKFNKGPQAIIYKTKKNYDKLVPVILSEDKSKIVSYPHPSDVSIDNKFLYPTKLNKGYLLDNKGINKNVAFLNITYEEYSKLKTTPSLKELFSMILDKDPLTEIYNCGNRYGHKNLITDINKMINDNKLNKCKCLKNEK